MLAFIEAYKFHLEHQFFYKQVGEMLMTQSTIDHIVIGAADLEKATKRIENLIKADFSTGGKHPLMATHNRLIKLQNSIYMEVISIDPSAPMPQSSAQKKRWFSLDSQSTKRVQPITAGRIKCRKRFVEEPQRSVAQQQPGERDATLLPGRQRPHRPVLVARKGHLLQRITNLWHRGRDVTSRMPAQVINGTQTVLQRGGVTEVEESATVADLTGHPQARHTS